MLAILTKKEKEEVFLLPNEKSFFFEPNHIRIIGKADGYNEGDYRVEILLDKDQEELCHSLRYEESSVIYDDLTYEDPIELAWALLYR